nr:DUF5668 domain-containing protein [uncultured Carboxylicivirga sp.]
MKEFNNRFEQRKRRSERATTGIFFIVAGLVLLLANLDVLPYQVSDVIFRWPMILIAFGFFNLLKRQYSGAIVLFAIGGFFMAPHLFPYVDFHDIFRFWPLLFVIIGISIFFRQKSRYTHRQIHASKGELIDEVNVFGGGVSQIESNNFKGGQITAIFGGSEINLERCELSEEGALIEMVTIFGGAKLIVPRGWHVKTEVVSIFGGFADKRTYYNETVTDPSKILVIKGVAIFGGGELRNF